MAQQSSNFWTSLPGIITALATLITAITGLYIAVQKYGSSDSGNVSGTTITEKPPVVSEQPQNKQHENKQPQVVIQPKNLTTLAPQNSIPKVDIKKLPEATQLSKATINNSATIAQLQSRPLVDCQYFPTVNTVRSLMSWSNYYHQQIVDAEGNPQRSSHACKKTINYRAQAHCKASADMTVRQALFETMSLCNSAGVSWKEAIPQQ